MIPSPQLPLDLPHRPAYGREDFLVAQSNRAAVAWLDRWPDWPTPALALHGPAGCGKSHLAHVWQARSRAVWVEPAALSASDPRSLAAGAPAVVLDLGSGVLADAAERPLLHLYNLLAEAGGHLLLCARAAPARWDVRLPDLGSRLAASPAAEVTAPDDRLIAAVLLKLFADRQLQVGGEVIAYLIQRMERSFAAAHATVAALDRAALAGRRAVSVPLAREVLAAGEGGPT